MQTMFRATTPIPAPEMNLMPPLYVAGGHQRAPRSLRAGNQDWNGYDQGLILQIDPRSGACTSRIEYISPPELVPAQDPAILFQAGYLQGNQLFICTQSEVMVFRLPDFERVWSKSLPCFNDLHHVRPSPDGHILVANAGLEMVMEISWGGEILHAWNVLGQDPWHAFSRHIDYRQISTKPHHAHPNYIFCVDDEIWVTRFHQGDALCLTDPRKRISLSTERVHDGVVRAGLVFFTTVNGRVIVANPRTLRIEEVIDLTNLHEPDQILGWCRGLYFDHDYAWVGFSRIRPTKFRENVSWVVRGFKPALPTHIACYDLHHHRCVAELNLEPLGLSAIYSIFPALN